MWNILKSFVRFGKPTILACAVLLLVACDDDSGSSSSDSELVNHTVQWGADNPTYLEATTTASEVIDFAGTGVAAITDGEAIVFDGKAFATDSSGEVRELVDDDTIIVSGITSNFQATATSTATESIDCQDDLNDYLNEIVGEDEIDRLATFTIRGSFSTIDYVLDNAVSEDTTVFSVDSAFATMVGFKNPYYFGDDTLTIDDVTVGLGEFPFHLHFVTDDEAVMGHVRDCVIDPGSEIEIGLVNIFDLRMNYGD